MREYRDLRVFELLESTLRGQLVAAMGLRYDPLIASVSESDAAPDFGEIYVDPQPSLLDLLKQDTSALVFADYGMGKTATRLALEYALRNSYETQPPLCVTYTPHIALSQGASAEQVLSQHLAAIATETAIDLIIQLIERSDKSAQSLSAEQQDALAHLSNVLPVRMRRQIRIAASAVDDLKDGVIWRGFRAVTRHVAITPQWRGWIDQIDTVIKGAPQPVSWEQTLLDVQALEFKRVFLLIDAVDEGAIERNALQAMVTPLLDMIEQFHDQDVLIKCFLPADLQKYFQIHYQEQFEGLAVPVQIASIAQVSLEHLEAIVNERLQAASGTNASFRSLDWFKGPDIEDSIQGHLALLAHGSPRRMIQLASHLLDFHSIHGFKDSQRLWLSAAEWYNFIGWLQILSLTSPE